jgi:hypothetical protein
MVILESLSLNLRGGRGGVRVLLHLVKGKSVFIDSSLNYLIKVLFYF